MRKILFILLIVILSLNVVSSSNIIAESEGWYNTYILPDDNQINIEIYKDSNNLSYTCGGDILIFYFSPNKVNDIYITTDYYTYYCSIDSYKYGYFDLLTGYNYTISYDDIYGNSYNNISQEIKIGYNDPTIKVTIGIDRSGLFIKDSLFTNYIYSYNNTANLGWVYANITTNIIEDNIKIKYHIIAIEDYDQTSTNVGKIADFIEDYIPFGNSIISILSAFTIVLTYSIKLLYYLITHTTYLILLIEIFILGHAITKNNVPAMLNTVIGDNIQVISLLIIFFKGIIEFIVKLVNMLKPI